MQELMTLMILGSKTGPYPRLSMILAGYDMCPPVGFWIFVDTL